MPDSSAVLAAERFRRMLLAMAAEPAGERGGWQDQVALDIGRSQTFVSMVARGERKPGLRTIERAIEKYGLRREYFFDESLVDPDYRDFKTNATGRRERDLPPFWTEFLENYERIDELDEADLDRMMAMGYAGRRGQPRIRGWADWAALADWILERRPSERFESDNETSTDRKANKR